MQSVITVQNDDFDSGAEIARLRKDSADVGAIVSFTGLVREFYDAAQSSAPGIQELFLEHYPGMTESALQQIADEASQRWELLGIRIIHRVGALHPGDQIVLVAVSSAHRQEAFSAAEFIMDYLKTRAPFWKRETSEQGSNWVAHRDSDDAAASRWIQNNKAGKV